MHTPTTISSFNGHIVDLVELCKQSNCLLLFFNKSCIGCTGRAIPLAYKLSKDFTNLNILIIHSDFGTDKTTLEDINALFRTGEAPFQIYNDSEAKLYQHFKCEGVPHWIILNKEANISRSIFGSQEAAQNRLYYALEENIR